MSAITYRDCLWTMANNAGLNADPLASEDGKTNVSKLNRSQWTSYLNDAIEYAWALDEFSIWPWIYKVAQPTVTDNTFPLSAIENAEYWTAWRVDPRIYYKQSSASSNPWYGRDLERLRLGSALDSDQATVMYHTNPQYDSALTGDVTVFYRPPVIKWTWTPVVTTTTYNTIGTLVYAGDAEGNVYKSIDTGALGSALTDATKWTPQTIPSELRKLVIADAERRRIKAISPSKTEGNLDYEMQVCAKEEERLLNFADQTQKALPWLRRSYEDPNPRSH